MRRQSGLWAVGLITVICAGARGGDPGGGEPPRPHIFQRFGPVGGWNPGGGLLHWWDPHCVTRWCGPDDYCRKPFPAVCRRGDRPSVIQSDPPPRPAVWWLPASDAPPKPDDATPRLARMPQP
jgi:hypothetical protein